MKQILRAYYQDGSATENPADIKSLLATDQLVEVDYDGGKGVKMGDSHTLKGETVLIGKEEFTLG